MLPGPWGFQKCNFYSNIFKYIFYSVTTWHPCIFSTEIWTLRYLNKINIFGTPWAFRILQCTCFPWTLPILALNLVKPLRDARFKAHCIRLSEKGSHLLFPEYFALCRLMGSWEDALALSEYGRGRRASCHVRHLQSAVRDLRVYTQYGL